MALASTGVNEEEVRSGIANSETIFFTITLLKPFDLSQYGEFCYRAKLDLIPLVISSEGSLSLLKDLLPASQQELNNFALQESVRLLLNGQLWTYVREADKDRQRRLSRTQE